MSTYLLTVSFVLGAIIGSFLNVVVYRYNTGMTLGGRSKCFSCNKTLTWIELFPIFSFLFQKGKCKKCHSKISWQYPAVELLTAILFTLIFYFFPPISVATGITTFFYLVISSLLVVITVYDAKHKIIPNAFVYTFDVLALIHISSSSQFLAGPILALPFFLFWLVSRGRWMGLGDAKLMLGIGWVLGLQMGISAFILAFWIGAIISVLWMAIVLRKFKKRYEIPFGPYLILGMYLVLFFHIQVLDVDVLISLFTL